MNQGLHSWWLHGRGTCNVFDIQSIKNCLVVSLLAPLVKTQWNLRVHCNKQRLIARIKHWFNALRWHPRMLVSRQVWSQLAAESSDRLNPVQHDLQLYYQTESNTELNATTPMTNANHFSRWLNPTMAEGTQFTDHFGSLVVWIGFFPGYILNLGPLDLKVRDNDIHLTTHSHR